MRIIRADIKQPKGKINRYFAKCIGAGRAAEIMRHDAYEQLKLIQKECPFEYILCSRFPSRREKDRESGYIQKDIPSV